MGQVTGRVVTDFQSLDYGEYSTGNHAVEDRRALDTPRLLLNMMHTERGSLWLPPAWDTLVTTVTGTGDILKIVQTFEPVGTLLVQKGTKVHLWRISEHTVPYGPPNNTFTLSTDEKVWVNVNENAMYFGNSAQTIKATVSGSVYSFVALGAPHGYHSMQYQNRRFVVERVFGTSGGVDERLYYSDIGAPETFGVDSFIDVTAYAEGDSWENAAGSPVAIQPFGDVLLLFLSQSIIRFTGTDPITDFTLRPSQSQTGLWMRDTVSHIDPGVIYFGGTPRGEWGFYLFRGASGELLSKELNGYLRAWGESGQEFNEDRGESVVWRNRYICALDVSVDPKVFVFDWQTRKWSTFNGYTRPTIGLSRQGTDSLCLADSTGTSVLSTRSPMARATVTTAGRFIVGYEDEEQPSGLARYLEVRLTVSVKATGGTGVKFDLTARNQRGESVVCPSQTLTTNGQHTLRFPLRLRGSSIELECTVTPSAAAHEAVVANLELVQSRKPLKVARIGGK